MPRQQAKHNTDIEVIGPRVLLRPFSDADIAAIEPWYDDAADRLEAARADPEAGLLVIARREDPAPIGLIDYRTGNPAPGWLTIGFIAVAAAYRGHGYGSEAVRRLEAEARRRGSAGRFRADVAMNNGLGVYFWLRLGYRPARPGELGETKPSLPRGTLTVIRSADQRLP